MMQVLLLLLLNKTTSKFSGLKLYPFYESFSNSFFMEMVFLGSMMSGIFSEEAQRLEWLKNWKVEWFQISFILMA